MCSNCLHCTVYSLKLAVCSVQCAVCSVQCAVYCVQCAVCSVQCGVYCVQCAENDAHVTNGLILIYIFFYKNQIILLFSHKKIHKCNLFLMFIFIYREKLDKHGTGCPNKHGYSVTNSISSF